MTIEPFVDPTAGGLVGILIDTAKKVGGGLAQAVGDRTQAATAIKNYADKYASRYGEVRLLGMKQGISLEAIYTKVRFLDELSIRQFISINTLEQTYREKQRRRFQIQEDTNLDSLKVVNENPCLMVLGSPGAGKSTFLRRMGLEALKGEKGNLKYRCIPVLLELKRFDSNNIDLNKAIVNELSNFGFPETETFALKLLEQGKLLILLDGLDEVTKAHQNAVIDSIQAFVTRYDKNRYIASCRIAAHRSIWNRFRDIEVADFNDVQIQQFINNWFRSDIDKEEKTAEQCWNTLEDSKNSAAKELAHTPLLLTFLCMVYDRTQGFPTNRATLYRKALDILLEEWAAEKRVYREAIYETLTPELEKVLLAEIAYNGFTYNQIFFAEQDLVDQIKKFLTDTVDKPKYLDGKAILNAIAIQQGILVERAEDVFSFSHLTIQEYLTAQYISDHRGLELMQKIVRDHLTDQQWREVFLLISGLLPNADQLLKLMEQEARKNIDNSSKFKSLFTWAEKVTTGSQGKHKLAAKRIAALELTIICDPDFLNVYSQNQDLAQIHTLILEISKLLQLDLSFVNTVSEQINPYQNYYIHSFNLAQNFAQNFQQMNIFRSLDFVQLNKRIQSLRNSIPDNSQPSQVRQAFRKYLLQIWFTTLSFNPELINLSTTEVVALKNYLYITELMLKCKEVAVRVSEKTWKGIEEQILKVNSAT